MRRQQRHMVWFCAYEYTTRCTYAIQICTKLKENKNYAVYCLIHCRPHYILLLLTFHISFLNNIHHHYELSNCCYYFVKKNARDPLLLILRFFFFVRIFHFASVELLLFLLCTVSFFAARRRRRRLSIAIISYEKLTRRPNCLAKQPSTWKEMWCEVRWAEKERAKEAQKRRLHPLFIQY